MKYRLRIAGHKFRMAGICALCLSAPLLWGCTILPKLFLGKQYYSNPRVIPAAEVPNTLSSIAPSAQFGYTGLAFSNGKLYASTNIGLLEYDGARLSKLYKWDDKDDVISGLWVNRANSSLWMYHNGMDKLIVFGGNNWGTEELPRPKEGYVRNDFLLGVEGFSNNGSASWLRVGNYIWRHDQSKGLWEREYGPPSGALINILPIEKQTLFIMRRSSSPLPLGSDANPAKTYSDSDVIYLKENARWEELSNKSGIQYITKTVVALRERAYILTEDERLLVVTPFEIRLVETPGACEAIAATSKDTLLASFRSKGIYEYAGGWQQKFSYPHQAAGSHYWAYLAESDGRIAFAITEKPKGLAGSNYVRQTSLWISSDNKLTQLSF